MVLLLTGATGFVGRNYLLRALGYGWHVYAPVRDAGKLRRQLAAEQVDTSNLTPLPPDPRRWLDVPHIDAAVHIAGVLFARDLDSYVETNVEWTETILRALPRGCPMVVLSSQSAGGPTPEGEVSRDEDMPDVPVSFYGESKLRMERLLRRDYEEMPIAILRPPMVIGPRDTAIQQLFRMARSPVRFKPGLKPKTLSFISCEDLLDAVDVALSNCDTLKHCPYYVASRQTFTDAELIQTAASHLRRRGITVTLPDPLVRLLSRTVDASPVLRAGFPSLTVDRVRELGAERWVVNPSAFESLTQWYAKCTLAQAIASVSVFG